MKPSIAHPQTQPINERLNALGLTLVALSSDGKASVINEGDKFERKLVESRIFTTTLALNWSQLNNEAETPTQLWPGLHLVRVDGLVNVDAVPNACAAALILSEPFASSEQLARICDDRRLDLASTQQSLQAGRLVSENELQRLLMTIGWIVADTSANNKQADEVHTLSEELSNTYEELSLLYTLSSSMNVNQPPVEFLMHACRELQQVADMSWVSLRLSDDEPRLEGLSGRVIIEGPQAPPEALARNVGDAVVKRHNPTGDPVIIEDTRDYQPDGQNIADNLLAVPLWFNNSRLGILLCGDRLDGAQFNSVDAKLCASLCNSLVIFLENMMLYEDSQAMFLGTLHALTSAIDAKDSYTRGHSERVAMLSRMLARKAGLDEDTCERVYLSGLIHDVGKIGVPEAVLSKPGKLTDTEFDLIKMHPQIGANILKDIRQMSDLIPGVLYHHEKWNGRGYPSGLAEDDIPLFGRLIGLADAFDAMSSTRTYRSAMQLSTVLEEIRQCAGSHFDPKLAGIFVDMDFTPFFELLKKHQQQSHRKSA